MTLPHKPFVPIIGFQNIVSASSVAENEWMHGRTNRQVENIMPPQKLKK